MSISFNDIISLAHTLEEIQNKQHDLWTWLPSYKVAQKNHGDYAHEYSPSAADIMTEASMYIAHLKTPDSPLSQTVKNFFETCPCGESHELEIVSD